MLLASKNTLSSKFALYDKNCGYSSLIFKYSCGEKIIEACWSISIFDNLWFSVARSIIVLTVCVGIPFKAIASSKSIVSFWYRFLRCLSISSFKVLKTIVKMFKNYKPLRFFTSIAIVVFILGILVGIPVLTEFFETHYITKIPSAILATGLVILSVIIGQCGVILDTVVKQNRENYELNMLRYKQLEDLKKEQKRYD